MPTNNRKMQHHFLQRPALSPTNVYSHAPSFRIFLLWEEKKKKLFSLYPRPAPSLYATNPPSFLISPRMCQQYLFKNYSLTLDCLTEWSSNFLPQHKVFSEFGPAYFFSLIMAHPRGSHRSDTLTSLQAPGRFRPASLPAFIHLTKIYWLLLTFRAMC